MSEQAVLFNAQEPAFTDDFSQAHVTLINYQTAARVITENHYLGAPGSTVESFGMFVGGELAGVCTYGTIPGPNARGVCGAEHASKVLELTRLFVFDWAGQNAESTFIAKTFALLKPRAIERGGVILVSYADTAAGHVGLIYQATNWIYTGSSVASKVVMPNGEVVHQRIASDSRRGASSAGMERIKGKAKHRYVTFVGRRDQVRRLRKSLRWPVLPYPKSDVTSPYPRSSDAGFKGETSSNHDEGPGSIPGHRSISTPTERVR